MSQFIYWGARKLCEHEIQNVKSMKFDFIKQKKKIRNRTQYFEHCLQEIITTNSINKTLLNSFNSIGDLFSNKLKLCTLQLSNECIKKLKINCSIKILKQKYFVTLKIII